MVQSPRNALLHPPFFLIPGINPHSPVSTQTEQIDQLNTLLLQEIDANFAKFHQVVNSKILPEIKRFALAGQPTREAAAFWKKFYEAAYGVRSTVEGASTIHDETQSQSTYDDHSMAIPRDDEQSFSAAHDAGSFVFGHGATASTPLAKKQYTGIGNDSWESSIESPFEKNDRRLRDMQIEGNAGHDFDDSSDLPTPSLPGGYSLDESTSSSPSIRPQSNPAGQSRPMSSTPKAARNPTASSFHPIGLRSTPLNAKFPKLKSKPSSNVNVHVNANSSSGPRSQAPLDFDDDSDDDDLPGMSPLRTTTFAHFPPRVQAINNAIRDKTPKKSVPAGAIVDSIMSEMGASASEFEGTYQPSPTGTPDFAKGYNKDFVSRYSLLPQEMGPKPVENLLAKLKASEAAPRNTRKSMANTSFGSDKVSGPGPGQGQGQLDDEEDSYDQDDSDDSDDSGTVPPPVESDVSYTTNDPGMTNRYDMTTTLHPGQQPERDSEVFGAPDRAPSAERAQLHIMRQEEMYTYMGGSLEDAAGREVEETPLRGVSRKTVKGQLDGRRAL